MSENSERLEAEALRLLLEGDDPVLSILREQLTYLVDVTREHTGVGPFTNFTLAKEAPVIPGRPSFAFGDVFAEIEGLEYGAGFVLFVTDGRLAMLDASSYGDSSWPETIGRFRVQYVRYDEKGLQAEIGPRRDLAALRRTPRWPR